jgi:hypothetical protein
MSLGEVLGKLLVELTKILVRFSRTELTLVKKFTYLNRILLLSLSDSFLACMLQELPEQRNRTAIQYPLGFNQ